MAINQTTRETKTVEAIRLEEARAKLDAWVFSDCCLTEFRMNRWGDSSGVRGAARLPPNAPERTRSG